MLFYLILMSCAEDMPTPLILKKLKLFPSTLKGASLGWFMGLGGRTINSSDDMKNTFLTKY